MCGIAGLLGADPAMRAVSAPALLSELRHRGPDDSGTWQDDETGLLLAHRRLAIVDLSAAGHQPMVSSSGRFVLSFNGEIYNHAQLREKIPFSGWRGHSDTETLLECFDHWGVKATLQATVGMFAISLWDRREKRLMLARDRLGEKPLYYGMVGNAFAFASELKPIRELPGFSAEIDRNALALYMRHNVVPAPFCIYQSLAKLLPGTFIEVSTAHLRGALPRPEVYWSAYEKARAGVANQSAFASDAEATDALESVLSEAVRGQMMSDVPLGAFLSGGVDSSTIVALMQKHSGRPVKSFSIGYHEAAYDEGKHAKAVANHLGTEHTEMYVTSADALAVIPKLADIYDEPFADSSQIPTYLVAALAREHVTVALSGDGGDELFGGYNRYGLSARLSDGIFRIPKVVRRGVAAAVGALSPNAWDGILGVASPALPPRLRMSLPGDKIHKAAAVLTADGGPALYRRLVSHWEGCDVVLDCTEPASQLETSWPSLPTLVDQMMAMDAVTYLPDDILVKVDRAAMAVSLETRVPLLDHRVFEFAWRLPFEMKVRGGVTKWLLREVLYRHVPKALIERPKMGFGVPIDRWLRGPLRDWAEDLLDENRLTADGIFDAELIRRKWEEHLGGRRNWQYHLWDVLMFQAWNSRQSALA